VTIEIVSQPEKQLGKVIDDLIPDSSPCKKIVFVSAFVALRTILRLREKILYQKDQGAEIIFNIGFDLFGTSKNVFDELNTWNCNVFVTHNSLPRVTFHPKMYLIETVRSATIIIGSNNLTDGGMFTNFENSSLASFLLPQENIQYQKYLNSVNNLINPTESGTTKKLSQPLIDKLSRAGLIINESEARKRSEKQRRKFFNESLLPDPFEARPVAFPPLPSIEIRRSAEEQVAPVTSDDFLSTTPLPSGLLVWEKVLPQSDVLQADGGTNPVGGVRLTQAKFRVNNLLIDQTQYFRQLFNSYPWEQHGQYIDQEHTFVPMRIQIGQTDYGVINFEISHKPSGEAEQGNYTTILHWGRRFSPIIRSSHIVGHKLRLYETPEGEVDFFIDIQP
jgi:HKD family nuclease